MERCIQEIDGGTLSGDKSKDLDVLMWLQPEDQSLLFWLINRTTQKKCNIWAIYDLFMPFVIISGITFLAKLHQTTCSKSKQFVC